MTDKELIKEEIEKYTKEEALKSNGSEFYGGRVSMCTKILSFIDSLPEEPASEDLEEAAYNYCEKVNHRQTDIITDSFKAGAEWQKRKMNDTLQTEYEKGRFDMREEMMKMAEDTAGLSLSWGEDSKTKIIIIEEEQL